MISVDQDSGRGRIASDSAAGFAGVAAVGEDQARLDV